MKARFYIYNGLEEKNVLLAEKRNVTPPAKEDHILLDGREYQVKDILHDFDQGIFKIFLKETPFHDHTTLPQKNDKDDSRSSLVPVISVFIKAEYIRDTQGYLGGNSPEAPKDGNIFDEEHEQYWQDVSAKVLVGQFIGISEAEAVEKIMCLYPYADPNVFSYEKLYIPDGEISQ